MHISAQLCDFSSISMHVILTVKFSRLILNHFYVDCHLQLQRLLTGNLAEVTIAKKTKDLKCIKQPVF